MRYQVRCKGQVKIVESGLALDRLMTNAVHHRVDIGKEMLIVPINPTTPTPEVDPLGVREVSAFATFEGLETPKPRPGLPLRGRRRGGV